jgi:hypothetical protein
VGGDEGRYDDVRGIKSVYVKVVEVEEDLVEMWNIGCT